MSWALPPGETHPRVTLLRDRERVMKRVVIPPACLLLSLLLPSLSLAATVELVAGGGEAPLGGPAIGAKLVEPFGIAFDSARNLYIAERMSHRITRIARDGKITLFAGTGEPVFGGDGGPALQASFHEPHRIVISSDQKLYVADTHSHRIRRIDLKSGRIETLAGNGEAGYGGDGGPGPRASFNGTFALDQAGGSVYVADLRNRRVRKVDLASGIVTTLAGNGERGIPTNGSEAAKSPLVDPRAVAADAHGNVYILERGGNALRVVDPGGRIRTLIGPGDVSPDLNGPKDLCLDRAGNVIIADAESHRIRKYDPRTGKLTMVAGTGEKGTRLVANDPLQTQLNRPHGVAVDFETGDLYISDSDNHRVLRLSDWQ
jgi:DNA-binding beta-propeller fold protein YncE